MENYTCCNAVLLLFFNRSDTTKRTLTQIAKVKPPRIYLACDGARSANEAEAIAKLRQEIINNINWNCLIYTRFLEVNLGCKHAVSSAISWFFSHEDQGIILEDDCLPTIGFFRFCDELLEYYADNQQVMMISGFSALGFCPTTQKNLESSYYFSKYNHIWGWASWRRAWKHYALEQEDFTQEFAHFHFASAREKRSWKKIFVSYYAGKIDTWDYPWTFSIWAANGLCIYPKYNMISNIGFNRDDATHTHGESKFACMATHEITFPLIHPNTIAPNRVIDKKNFTIVFDQGILARRIMRKIWKLMKSPKSQPHR